ncbi:MAG: element excision factor XisH family protein [Coleofasciculus sp. G3-WIS-01]
MLGLELMREKEQWTITDDPLRLEVGGTKFEIDLGAEQVLAAERGEEKIAVEIKTFLSDSPLTDYHAALGQFLNYRLDERNQRSKSDSLFGSAYRCL